MLHSAKSQKLPSSCASWVSAGRPVANELRGLLEGVLRCGQAHSLGDLWHALGRVQEGERRLPPDLYDTIRWFCQVTGLASGLKVASVVADIKLARVTFGAQR